MLRAEHNNQTFIIEEDHPEVGVYLYIYEDDKCVRDFLQNDTETCIEIAFEDYGVPKNAWSPMSDTSAPPPA